MESMITKCGVLLGLSMILGAGLTACSGGVPGTTGSSQPAGTAGSAAANGAVPTPAASRPPDRLGACTAQQLRVTIGEPDAGAGQLYHPILFTNIGDRPCTLTGYPGVSLLDAAGSQIGSAATRSGQPVTPVTVSPGGTAQALVHTSNHGVGYDNPTCRPVSTYVRVYPPDTHTGVRAPYRLEVCTGPFEVSPVRPGTG